MDDADSDTLYERRMLALGVRGELAAAGLPIAAEDLSYYFGLGAEVQVDYARNVPPGGIWVRWCPHPRLREAAVKVAEALLHECAHDPTVKHEGAVSKAMADAIFAILVSAGYKVVYSDDSLRPFALRVVSRPPRPVWTGDPEV
jgi:hypothetical protein